MKKLFFLFAAAALLTACSSDELSETTGGGGTTTNPDTEQTVSSSTVELNNGIEIAVGALDNATATRVEEATGAVNFVINLNKIDNVLEEFGDYKLKADDFAIRRDGVYDGVIKPTDNKYQYWTIEMVEDSLKVAVKNLEKLTFSDCKDYTFEFYLWIENKKLLNDGSGSYGELFDDEDKSWWISQAVGNWPVAEGEETGKDFSEVIWNKTTCGQFDCRGEEFFEKGAQDAGLLVRYNVYRGLQGKNGDTPYIKVSIHVEQQDQTTVGNKGNQATWVSIPYTPHKSLSKDSSDILSVK